VVSKLPFCLHLQQVIAQLGELHIFGAVLAPALCRSSPGNLEPGWAGVFAFPLLSLQAHPVAAVALGSWEGEAACVLGVSDRGAQTTRVYLSSSSSSFFFFFLYIIYI